MIFQGTVVAQKWTLQDRYLEAARLYKTAADMGYAPAQFNYSMCNEMGHGIPKDAAVSLQYLQLSAQAGYPLAVRHVTELAQAAQNANGLDRITGKSSEGDEWAYEFLGRV
jgi:TPR repeat protein